MQETQSLLAAGQQVTVRDEAWTIVGAERFPAAQLVHLRGADTHNRGELRTVIAPFDEVRPLAAARWRRLSRRAACAAAAAAIAGAAPFDRCWTAGAARIDVRPWQLAPAQAVLQGAMRVVLADHVGLGKTIQAGLIIAELMARGLARRALVLTPASLRQQWASELRARFFLRPAVFDHDALLMAAMQLPPDVNPWRTAPLIVSSIDLAKRPEVRRALEAVPFDVLVVDEAHHLTPGSDRAAVVQEIAARTSWVVLATATPHTGDAAAYALLLEVGALDARPPAVFRRSRAVLGTPAARRSRLLAVAPTPQEQQLLAAAAAYAKAVRRQPAVSAGAHLVATTIARRAAASAAAAARTLRRRVALLAEDDRPQETPTLPWEEAGAADADLTDAQLAVPGLADRDRERVWLAEMAALADAAGARWSKLAAITRLLRRTREQMLVFSEYRDVVERAAAGLAEVAAVAVLHGALSARERSAAVRAFTSGSARVLVATDAAGEGLNLHQRCRWVVTFELPWTPLRLEQRIGRVDRIGQARRVHALNLVHRDSYEATVIVRLERRRARAAAMDASHAAAALSRDAPSPQSHDLPALELERRLRALAALGTSQPRAPVYAPRRRRQTAVVVLLAEVTHCDRDGRLLRRATVALRVALSREVRRLTPSVLRDLWTSAAVRAALDAACPSQEETLDAAVPLAHAWEHRLRAVQKALGNRAGDALWQGSLFDKRAEQRAMAEQSRLESLQRHLEAQLETAQSLRVASRTRWRPLAAWQE